MPDKPKFDKDIELAKVNLVAEEWRGSYLMKIGSLLAAFVTVSAVLLAAQYASQISWTVTVAGILLAGIVDFVITKYWLVEPYVKRTQRLDFWLNEMRDGHSIGELSELLKEKY